LDADFTRDYGPEKSLEVALPEGFRVLQADGSFTAQQMLTILQRVKIVLDLGLPVLVLLQVVSPF